MEDKRLDFDAPLLTARRFSAPGVAGGEESSGSAVGKPLPRRTSLPLYKSELKSGPVGKPGIVPFLWEQTPGRPKGGPAASSVRTIPPDRALAPPKPPPGRNLKDKDLDSSPTARLQSPLSSSLDESKVGTPESPSSGPNKGKEEAEEKRPMPRDCHTNDEGEDDDAFSDALDTLSRTESYFMNCSVSGLTGGPEVTEHSGSFATDPQVRDFMMGRFLPAAQAMASSSPQYAPRKPSAPARETARAVERVDNEEYRRPLPLPNRHKTNYVPQYAHELEEEDGYENDEYHTGRLASKACGLLPQFCLKSSFCLLNPVPGLKVPGRLPPSSRRIKSTLNKNLHHSAFGQIGDEYSWEAVYKHKLGRGESPQLEEGSKLTSESNQLTYWSDSLTADGSSPYRRSAGGISPYRNETSQSPFHEGKGFLGVPKSSRKSSSDSCGKDRENSWEVATHSGSLKGSGSLSLAVERTLFVDSVLTPEVLHSKSSSMGSMTDIKSSIDVAHKNSEVEVECQRMEEILVIEAHEKDRAQLKDSEYVEPGLQFFSERSGHGEMGDNNSVNPDSGHDDPLPFKTEDQGKNAVNPLQSLLPPPLPKSPSESWLRRTLPSVLSKNSLPHSLLGIQVQSRRQALPVCNTRQNWEGNVKPSKVSRQIRFADVLTKPMSPKSEA